MTTVRSLTTVLAAAALLTTTACRDKDSSGADAGNGSDGGSDDVTIQDVQDDSMPVGTAVTLRGVVVIAIDTYGARTGSIYIMEPGGGAFSGTSVFLSGTQAAGLAVGDLVDVENAVKDEFALSDDTTGRTLTQLRAPDSGNITVTKVGTGTVPAPEVVNPWDLVADDAEAEKWEGVLIQFDNVSILSAPRNVTQTDPLLKEMDITGPFPVSSALTELADTISRDDCYASIVGIGDYFFDYKLLPRSAADLTTGGTSCPAQEEGDTACGDSEDNDYDGFADCADFSCQDTVAACVTDTTVVMIQDGTVSSGAVSLNGVVITAIETEPDGDEHLFVADSGTAAVNNGIYVFRGSGAGALDGQFTVGATIDLTGRVKEFNSLTEIETPTLTFVSGGAPNLTPLVVSYATLADDGATGEPYEGVLVEVQDVTVVSEDAGFGKFTVGDSATPLNVDDNIYKHSATAGQCFSSIVGVMHWNPFDDERILLPRSADDVTVVTCP